MENYKSGLIRYKASINRNRIIISLIIILITIIGSNDTKDKSTCTANDIVKLLINRPCGANTKALLNESINTW